MCLILDDNEVYRIAVVTDRDSLNRQIPAIRCFALVKNDNGNLSVDWDQYTSPNESVARIGAQLTIDLKKYKNYTNREVYGLNCGLVRKIDGISDIKHNPLQKNERIPENLAHSHICCVKDEENQPELFLHLREIAKNNRKELCFSTISKLVEELRNTNS